MSSQRSGIDFYVTGGTMAPGAESYVVRSADDELFRAIQRGEYCYVLTTRQMGKSSLMARTARRLAVTGMRSAQITLETIRETGGNPDPDRFLYGVARLIHKELGLTSSLADWWRKRKELSTTTGRFHEFLTEFLLDSCREPIVVFIDEIDSTIGLPFADDFYATIRACYNGRSSTPELSRLTFVLLGVATPAQLIADPARTPFNVGKGIELTDFTIGEAEPLTHGFPGSEERKRALLERVLHWTGGHPYLTQTLCRALATRLASGGVDSTADPNPTVDAEVDRLFLRPEAAREEANLKFVRSRLTRENHDLRAVLRTYQRVLAGQRVEDKPASSIHASLKLAGVVRTDGAGLLRTRNRIYAQVFGSEWVKRERPSDRVRLVASAAFILLLVGGGVSFFTLRQALSNVSQQTLQAQIVENLATGDFANLVAIAQKPHLVYGDFYSSRWDELRVVLSDDFLKKVDPGVLATMPWEAVDTDPKKVLDLAQNSYRVLVSSRALFGALSFAVEEISLRNPADSRVSDRARALSEAMRAAFISYHTEKTPDFRPPPERALDDPLNAWIKLPAGDFTMGSELPGELPVHLVHVSDFLMQQHEVTNEEYRRFDPGHDFPAGQERHPVANVSWYEAVGYAAWLGASLPTEAQWEYAARGTGKEPAVGKTPGAGEKGRLYPWGSAPATPERAVYNAKSTKPVGSVGKPGQTPEGLDDLAGNVSEWCRDWYGSYAAEKASDPLGPIAGRASKMRGAPRRVWRGGSFYDADINLRATDRRIDDTDPHPDRGFRLVSSRLRP